MKYEIKKLSFIQTWKEAFKLYADNFIPLFAICMVSNLPIIFFSMPRITLNAEGKPQGDFYQLMMWLGLLIILGSLSTMLMMEYIAQKYRGKHLTANEYLKNLTPILGSILGLAFFTTFMIAMGMMAFVFPGIYIALTLSVSGATLIVERQPVAVAIVRSVKLTQNKKMEIFAYSLFLGIISLVVERILFMILSSLEHSQLVMRLQQAIGLMTQSLLGPISACLFFLIYFNLRIEKEGFFITQSDKTDTETN